MTTGQRKRNVLLHIDDLSVWFQTASAFVEALKGVSFSIGEGESLALWGHSGCGKTTICRAILGLPLGEPGIVSGSASYGSQPILPEQNRYARLSGSSIAKNSVAYARHHRQLVEPLLGRQWRVVWQEPIYSFEPNRTIGAQAEGYFRRIAGANASLIRQLREEFSDTLSVFDLDHSYIQGKHNLALSGGECQRICIAMSLVGNPRLLIADEPTTALDDRTRERVITYIRRKQLETRMSILIASHNRQDLVALSDNIAVLCSGRIVERMPACTLAESGPESFHPYTQYLWFRKEDLVTDQAIRSGSLDSNQSDQCAYLEQCPLASDDDALREVCASRLPPEIETTHGHSIACVAFAGQAQVSWPKDRRSSATPKLCAAPSTIASLNGSDFMTMLNEADSLRAVGIKKSFVDEREEEHVVLDSLDFELPRACVFGLLGKTGVGKTTLGKILAGIWRPDAGQVVAGHLAFDDLSHRHYASLRRWIRYVPQNPDAVIDSTMTVSDSLSEVKKLSRLLSPSRESWAQLLEQSQTISFDWRARRTSDLSLGQRRRVVNYRALVSCPSFVVMDEPFNGLDVVAKDRTLRLLKTIARDWEVGILLISHDKAALEDICDTVWIMDGQRSVRSIRSRTGGN